MRPAILTQEEKCFLLEREMKSLVPTCGLPHVVSISMPPVGWSGKEGGWSPMCSSVAMMVTVMEELIKRFGS